MSMLSDYQRMVEKPMVEGYERCLAAMQSTIEAQQAQIAELLLAMKAKEEAQPLISDGAGSVINGKEVPASLEAVERLTKRLAQVNDADPTGEMVIVRRADVAALLKARTSLGTDAEGGRQCQ